MCANVFFELITFLISVSLKVFCDENGKWNFSQLQWMKKCTKRSSTERRAVINSLFNIDNEVYTVHMSRLLIFTVYCIEENAAAKMQ